MMKPRWPRASMRARSSRLLPRLLWLVAWPAAVASPRLAGWVAANLWFVPWQRRGHAHGVGSSPGAIVPVTVDVPGAWLHGFEAGQGPTVLLVHGWADQAASLSAFVAPVVAAGHRVVAVDLPAHGTSGGYRTDGYVMARTVQALAEQVGAEVVIAHSLGALATTVALRAGLALRAVVLLAPSVRLEHALNRFAAQLRLPRQAVKGLRGRIEGRFGEAVWGEFAADRHAAGLDVPALIVHDRDDRQVAVDDARALAAAWPGARLVETSGLGHRRLLQAADVVRLVTAFVREPARHEPQETPAGR